MAYRLPAYILCCSMGHPLPGCLRRPKPTNTCKPPDKDVLSAYALPLSNPPTPPHTYTRALSSGCLQYVYYPITLTVIFKLYPIMYLLTPASRVPASHFWHLLSHVLLIHPKGHKETVQLYHIAVY